MENDPGVSREPLSPEEAKAKAAILAECQNLAAAGVTFVAVHLTATEIAASRKKSSVSIRVTTPTKNTKQ